MRKRTPQKISYTAKARMNTRGKQQPSPNTRAFVDTLEAHPAYRMILVTSVIAAVLAFSIDLYWRIAVDRPAQREEAIARAWGMISNPNVSQLQKRKAFRRLVAYGETLEEIDLSCPVTKIDKESYKCRSDVDWQFLELENANLRNARFEYAKLSNSDFKGANISHASFKFAYAGYTNFTNITAQRAHFHRAYLYGSNFTNSQLSGTIFYKTDLGAAILENAKLNDVEFVHAWVRDVRFSNSEMNSIVFRKSRVSHSDFGKAKLRNVDFKSTDLTGASFAGVDLNDTNFSGTNLSKVIFCNTQSGCARNFAEYQLNQGWAWRDTPPILATNNERFDFTLTRLCDPAMRQEYKQTQKFGVPKGCRHTYSD